MKPNRFWTWRRWNRNGTDWNRIETKPNWLKSNWETWNTIESFTTHSINPIKPQNWKGGTETEPKPNWNWIESDRIERVKWEQSCIAINWENWSETEPNPNRKWSGHLSSLLNSDQSACSNDSYNTRRRNKSRRWGTWETSQQLRDSSGFFGFLRVSCDFYDDFGAEEVEELEARTTRSQHSHRSWDASRFFKILRWLLRSDQSVKKKPKRNPNKKENQTSNKKKSVINSLKKLQSETVARSGGSVG